MNHKEVISAKLGRGDLRSDGSANGVEEEVTGKLQLLNVSYCSLHKSQGKKNVTLPG